ncbi:MAG: F0F1 ATP synthase subunit B [Bacteroidales bacterium]|nr:F0F1 ATP synthase subunit B [Bacteroidales bacterium]
MSLITPDFGLIFWMTLIFAIVFFILAKFGFPIITGMVEKRNERITQSLQLAKEAEKRLDEIAVQQANLLEETRAEQNRLIQEAAHSRDTIIAQAHEQAQAEADKVMEHAREQIASDREAALNDIRAQVAAFSMEVAEKVIRKNLSEDAAQVELINSLVDELVKSDKE